jgi:Cd2+/Zn2+-exporting ATPase
MHTTWEFRIHVSTRDGLLSVPWIISHARRAVQVIRVNVWFAIGIKVLFVVMAATGRGTLWLAVLADTGATALVTLNGLRMLRPRQRNGSDGTRRMA